MNIECPECGTKNVIDKALQPNTKYKCGKCGKSITFLQSDDAGIKEDALVIHKETKIEDIIKPTLVVPNTSGQSYAKYSSVKFQTILKAN